MRVLTERPKLDDHDFETVRLLYGQAQQWARHYDQMVVSANVLLVSASLIFLGLAMDPVKSHGAPALVLLIPAVMTVVGFLLTHILYIRYSGSIGHIIHFENLLNVFDEQRFAINSGDGSLLPKSLMQITRTPSIVFFEVLHSLLLVVYFVLAIVLR